MRLRLRGWAEALTCALFVGLMFFNVRFHGFLMVAAVPYLGRDLSELAGVVRWPVLCRSPGARAALVAAASVLVAIPEWTRPQHTFGVGWEQNQFPRRACDVIAEHRLRGPLFNPNYYGGYLMWRFWPEKSLLPFMDVHQSRTREDRDLYTFASVRREAWQELVRRHDLQLAVLDGHQEWIAGEIGGVPLDECQRLGEAWEKLGDRRRSAQWYRRKIDIHPYNELAHEGLRRIGAGE